jgi:hypothetical protein
MKTSVQRFVGKVQNGNVGLILLGFISLFASAVSCVIQLWPMEYHYVDMDYLQRIQPEVAPDEIQRRLVSYISECADNNADTNGIKSKLAIAAAVSATVSVFLFSVSAVILFIILR